MTENPIRQSLNGLEYQYNFGYTESWGGSSGGFILSLSVGSSLKEFDNEDRWAIQKQIEEIEEILRGRIYRADPENQRAAVQEKADILACFQDALPICVEEIPNEYSSGVYGGMRPWFLITTARGKIKVGWRKRVLKLDWSASKITSKAEDLFSAEDVTKGDRYIHCYDYASLKNHVKAIMKSRNASEWP